MCSSAYVTSIDIIAEAVERVFPNGMRPDSVIDRARLKKALPPDVDVDDVALRNMLPQLGISCDGRIHVIPGDGRQRLADLLRSLMEQGHRLLFYDELLKAHASLLAEMRVFSADVLQVLLRGAPFQSLLRKTWPEAPALVFRAKFFATDEDVSVESEIESCFHDSAALSYDDIRARLPWIPLDAIRRTLTQNPKFVWDSTARYALRGRIAFDAEEEAEALALVEREVEEHGWATLASLSFERTRAANPGLSPIAIANAFFMNSLARSCARNGRIVSKKNRNVVCKDILEDFCRRRDSVSLDELRQFVFDLYGTPHNNRALIVVCDTMIRADADTFVADRSVAFDVDAADRALSQFVTGDVIPLRAVTSFTSFPPVEGFSWNPFLLESYCRRFSRDFRCQCLVMNSKNVGAVFRRSANFPDYVAVLAHVVVRAGVPLDKKGVGDFLFGAGYVAQRSSSVDKVIAAAARLAAPAAA